MNRSFVLATVAIATLLLAACGDDPTPEPEDIAGINSCDLVTRDDAAEALGRPVDDAQEGLFGDRFHECLYRLEGGSQFDSAVTIQARVDSTREEYDLLLSGNCPSSIGEPKPIEGLGDAAHQCIPTFVFAGDVILVVTVINNEDPAAGTAQQVELARTALENLP